MMMDRYSPVLAAGQIGAGIAASVGVFVPLPSPFPYSDAVLLGGSAFAIAFGLGMMLPDSVRLTPAERATMALIESGRVTKANVRLVVERIETALMMAARLRKSDNGFRKDLGDQVRLVASELEAVADDIWGEPARASEYGSLLARGILAVEAAEAHARLRKSRKVSEEDVAASRSKVADTLAAFEDVLDDAARRRIEARLDVIDVTTSVAGELFRQMRK